MRALEWLFCGYLRLLWAVLLVDRPGVRPRNGQSLRTARAKRAGA